MRAPLKAYIEKRRLQPTAPDPTIEKSESEKSIFGSTDRLFRLVGLRKSENPGARESTVEKRESEKSIFGSTDRLINLVGTRKSENIEIGKREKRRSRGRTKHEPRGATVSKDGGKIIEENETRENDETGENVEESEGNGESGGIGASEGHLQKAVERHSETFGENTFNRKENDETEIYDAKKWQGSSRRKTGTLRKFSIAVWEELMLGDDVGPSRMESEFKAEEKKEERSEGELEEARRSVDVEGGEGGERKEETRGSEGSNNEGETANDRQAMRVYESVCKIAEGKYPSPSPSPLPFFSFFFF